MKEGTGKLVMGMGAGVWASAVSGVTLPSSLFMGFSQSLCDNHLCYLEALPDMDKDLGRDEMMHWDWV